MHTYTFDVDTSEHDAVKVGVLVQRTSRVTVLASEFRSWVDASEAAACVAVAIHGGMPTAVRPII